MKSDKFDLVLILDSQSPQTINCNMNDKVEKTLKEFASMKKIEYSLLDVVLYGGKALLPEDRKKLFSDISSSFDKYEKKMTLVLYSKTPEDKCTKIQEEVLLEPEDIKINLIIDSKRPLLLQAKRGETIKEILIRKYFKITNRY